MWLEAIFDATSWFTVHNAFLLPNFPALYCPRSWILCHIASGGSISLEEHVVQLLIMGFDDDEKRPGFWGSPRESLSFTTHYLNQVYKEKWESQLWVGIERTLLLKVLIKQRISTRSLRRVAIVPKEARCSHAGSPIANIICLGNMCTGHIRW